MTDLKPEALVKAVEGLLAEKEAVAQKEQELITSLNAVLNKMGYQVVAMPAPGRGRRGRPPGSGNGRRRRRGRPPKAGARRRGRPPKAQPTA